MKSVCEQWAGALESGEFEQCRGKLQEGGAYCVIGVLLVLAERAEILPKRRTGEGFYFRTIGQEKMKLVQKWAGLNSPIFRYHDGTEYRYLQTDNDTGQSFRELAATIRKYKTQIFKD